MPTTNRPFGVALISVVLLIAGALDIVGGGLLFLERNDVAVIQRMGSADEIGAWSLGVMCLGVIVIVLAAALRNGSSFARYLIALIAGVRAVALLYAIASFAKGDWYDALVPAVVYGLVAGYLLFDKDSQAFFARTA
jgi:hypothetical protein